MFFIKLDPLGKISIIDGSINCPFPNPSFDWNSKKLYLQE